MSQVILIYANCVNPTAKGDFSLAGSIAKDLSAIIKERGLPWETILTSEGDGTSRFSSLYGNCKEGRVTIEGHSVGLCALEDFDAINNEVVALIEANHCKYPSTHSLKHVLSPHTKFLFVGAANQQVPDEEDKINFYRTLSDEHTEVYDYYSRQDILFGSSGIGTDRLGLPEMNPPPKIHTSQKLSGELTSDHYGLIYAYNDNKRIYRAIAQYMKLTRLDHYLLVGNFKENEIDIQKIVKKLKWHKGVHPSIPEITCIDELDNTSMRSTMENAHGNLIMTTGVMSTLEALHDAKLAFYQFMEINCEFVFSWLSAMHSICINDASLSEEMKMNLMELSLLLFGPKPLGINELTQLSTILSMTDITEKLIEKNQTIIRQSSGTLAPNLLDFITAPTPSNSANQTENAVRTLCKTNNGYSTSTLSKALRRAAATGDLLVTKILTQSMDPKLLDTPDTQKHHRTALHWAVINNNTDCAAFLVSLGANPYLSDNLDKTALDYAENQNDEEMKQILLRTKYTPPALQEIVIRIKDDSEKLPSVSPRSEAHQLLPKFSGNPMGFWKQAPFLFGAVLYGVGVEMSRWHYGKK